MTLPLFFTPITMIDTLNSRIKAVTLMVLGAIMVAAFLRHTLHVYGGISPADIRSDSLLLVAAVAIVVVFFRLFQRVRT